MKICRAKLTAGSSTIHELLSNLVNSSDRVANLVREEDRDCPYEVYLQDRNKIV